MAVVQRLAGRGAGRGRRLPAVRAAVRRGAAAGSQGSPLFDTDRWSRDVERLYAALWELQTAAPPPEPGPSEGPNVAGVGSAVAGGGSAAAASRFHLVLTPGAARATLAA